MNEEDNKKLRPTHDLVGEIKKSLGQQPDTGMKYGEVKDMLAAVRQSATDPNTVKLAECVEWLLAYASELETQIDETSSELKRR